MKLKAFFHSGAIVLYCTSVGYALFNARFIFGDNPSFLIPVSMLLLFSFSALFCGLLAFYTPYILFFENKKKQAIDMVLYETMWLFLFFVILLIGIAVLH